MPNWLNNALLIILIIWTMWEMLAWTTSIYVLYKRPWMSFEWRLGAFASTIFMVVCWIVLICYWLR